MDYTNYGKNRFKIIYGEYDGIEKTAIDKLYGLVQGYVPYVLTLVGTADFSASDTASDNLIVIGTMESNPLLKELAETEFFVPENRPEGYSIKTSHNPKNPDLTITVLQGADEAGVLYAVSDYERCAIRNSETYHDYHYNKKYRPFMDAQLPFEKSEAPAIEHRGFWSWGHVIFDYRKYIDHMTDCKLNTLIIWNDFAPLNAEEVISYAHEHAVKIIWGFSWCWGEKVNPDDPEELKKWTDYVLHTYETQYLPLDCDGIYFQAFTETSDTTINGRSISDMVIDWVNSISTVVYKKYPDLWIQFGLHATSVQSECNKFSAVDSRMSIVWENAGGFPYSYDPTKNENESETLAYTEKLLNLRGENERFGAVLKGFTVLNWGKFEHQKGVHILGKASEPYIKEHTAEKEFYWRYAAPYWVNQAPFLKRFLQSVAAAPISDRLITALVEDGMWESGIHVSAQLFAELLWNPDADVAELLTEIMHDARTSL